MNSVLLTGATGFIGQNLQKSLLKAGFPVTALIRPESAHPNSILESVQRLSGELSDLTFLTGALNGVSAVIYCAGSVRGRRLKDFQEANVAGVRYMVNAMNNAAADIPMLLMSSLAASRPQVSDYANSKYLGEREVADRACFPWTIFRPPAVYGPGDHEMLPILKMARRGMVTPTGPRGQRLSLIHVNDLAAAAVAWLESWEDCEGQIFTLDDGHAGGYGWDEIARIVSGGKYRKIHLPGWLVTTAGHLNLAFSRLLGYQPMLTPGKARELTQPDWVCNNTPLSEAADWYPAITLETGVTELLGKAHERNTE